jgi:hypothetical protein
LCTFINFISITLLLFADSVYVVSPLFIDFCGLFTRLWPPFTDSIYVGLPLFVDFCGLFTRLWPPFIDFV